MLSCKAAKFSLPQNVTYLNCAYMSPMLKSVEKAGLRAVRLKRNPAAISAEDFFTGSELLRAEFAQLVNVSDAKRIAIIPSVSYGMATIAGNIELKKGQHIIVAAEQFPSNYYVWESLCAKSGGTLKVVDPDNTSAHRGKRWNEKILEAIDTNTRAVAIAHTHWADGTRFDLEKIRERTREVGALLIVDGTQSVGALPFDVASIQPDALVCAGYKWLLGPYSIALAYYGEYFSNGRPLEENWISRLNSEDFSALVTYESRYQPGAMRYDMGERSNFILVPMMHNALTQLNRWQPHEIQEYCKSITESPLSVLKDKGFWVEDLPYRASHLFGIRAPENTDIQSLKTRLKKHKVHVSFRGESIRVSPNVYNNEADMQRLVKVLSGKIK